MKRQDKYPETSTFHFHNANPKNRYTTDCVIRAISTAVGLPYHTVLFEMAGLQSKTGYDMSEKKCIDMYLQSKGWRMHAQPRKADGTKYTGAEFCTAISKSIEFLGKAVVANIGGHHIVCIKETTPLGYHKVYDTWDSTDGCIGNYWVKR